ncbi:unnamed protein product [Amoebophrya sp. A120]|nr:unnamed protein product [Amoebophrya sp. A120]|eukprot:GSA120T00017423001.1
MTSGEAAEQTRATASVGATTEPATGTDQQLSPGLRVTSQSPNAKRPSVLEPSEIDDVITKLDGHIEKIEKFLTINHELTEEARFSVKRQSAQIEFLHLSGKVRDIVVENRESRACMRAMFHESDRAGRLMYIHDTAFHLVEKTSGGQGELLAKTINFAKPIQHAIEQQRLTCEPWEVMHQNGALRVGFGPALDPECRDKILKEAGKYVPPPPKPSEPDISENIDEEPTEEPTSQEQTRDHTAAPPEAAAPVLAAAKQDSRGATPSASSTAGFAPRPCARFTSFRGNLIMHRTSDEVSGDGNGKPSDVEDEVVGITDRPVQYFDDHGYYVEIEVGSTLAQEEQSSGCMGLGVTFMRPDEVGSRMPKRLEKLKQGWFFTGPYKGGTTRRVYRHGKKDIRFILDGEESEPLRWSPGDKMSLLIRPKDAAEPEWQWTISLYINRNIVLACTIDVPPSEDGSFQGVPRSLDLYACAEAYGYVTSVKLNPAATPHGLAIAGLKGEGQAEQT